MGVGEVVGGIALVGVAALIGLAITDDDEPETLTEAASTLVDPAAAGAGPTSTATTLAPDTSSESTSTESTAPAEPTDPTDAADTTEDEPDETPPTETAATDVPASSTTTSTVAASTTPAPPAPPTTLSAEQRAAINVKVLNGGAASGAAGDVTAALRFTGFTAAGPADARVGVQAKTVLYAPFQRPAADAVNELVGAQPVNVREVSPADPNWAAFGAGLDVLVVLGPGPG